MASADEDKLARSCYDLILNKVGVTVFLQFIIMQINGDQLRDDDENSELTLKVNDTLVKKYGSKPKVVKQFKFKKEYDKMNNGCPLKQMDIPHLHRISELIGGPDGDYEWEGLKKLLHRLKTKRNDMAHPDGTKMYTKSDIEKLIDDFKTLCMDIITNAGTFFSKEQSYIKERVEHNEKIIIWDVKSLNEHLKNNADELVSNVHIIQDVSKQLTKVTEDHQGQLKNLQKKVVISTTSESTIGQKMLTFVQWIILFSEIIIFIMYRDNLFILAALLVIGISSVLFCFYKDGFPERLSMVTFCLWIISFVLVLQKGWYTAITDLLSPLGFTEGLHRTLWMAWGEIGFRSYLEPFSMLVSKRSWAVVPILFICGSVTGNTVQVIVTTVCLVGTAQWASLVDLDRHELKDAAAWLVSTTTHAVQACVIPYLRLKYFHHGDNSLLLEIMVIMPFVRTCWEKGQRRMITAIVGHWMLLIAAYDWGGAQPITFNSFTGIFFSYIFVSSGLTLIVRKVSTSLGKGVIFKLMQFSKFFFLAWFALIPIGSITHLIGRNATWLMLINIICSAVVIVALAPSPPAWPWGKEYLRIERKDYILSRLLNILMLATLMGSAYTLPEYFLVIAAVSWALTVFNNVIVEALRRRQVVTDYMMYTGIIALFMLIHTAWKYFEDGQVFLVIQTFCDSTENNFPSNANVQNMILQNNLHNLTHTTDVHQTSSTVTTIVKKFPENEMYILTMAECILIAVVAMLQRISITLPRL